jgi:hypothetical protein
MRKNNFIKILIIVLISIVLVILISSFLLDNTGKINQGNYRITDAVIKSTLEITEKQEEQIDSLSNLVLDISQKNTLELLITKNVDIESATIDNIKVENPIKTGNITIKQSGYDDMYNLDENTVINIYPEEKLEQYYIKFYIINQDCITDVNVPSQTNVVKFDGTILELLNQSIDDLKGKVSFNLNLYEENGTKNTCKIELEFPDDELLTEGISVKRDDLSKYIFKVKK